MTTAQKETIKWVGIATVGGLLLYNVGKKLGIFSDASNSLPTNPTADTNTPKASDYTHTKGFDATGLINRIVNDWTTFGGDPFNTIFSQIKATVNTQGDWQVFNNAFNARYNEHATDYMSSWIEHAPWATVSKSEISQLVSYINSLPL